MCDGGGSCLPVREITGLVRKFIYPPRPSCCSDADRLARTVGHRDAVRPRGRRRGHRRHPRVRPPGARRSSCRRSRATSSAPGCRRTRSTARCARSPSRARSIYELDEDALARLQPDLIVTQALCAVCAVSYDDVRAIAERMDSARGALARPAHARRDARRRAHARRRRPTPRTPASISCRTRRAGSTACGSPCAPPSRSRVAAIEWLDPVFVAGHWTPQLIEYAGGFDVLGMAGEHSEQRDWDEVRAAQPEVVVVMPCGYDAERALEEAETYADELESLGARRVVAVDAAGAVLPPRPAADRRPRAARPHPAPGPAPRGAGRGARGRVRARRAIPAASTAGEV